MIKVTITAVKAFEHCGRVVEPGEVLDVKPIEAAALKYRGHARLGNHAPPTPEPAPSPEPPKRKRTYRRRDLRAES